tara:strand:- start:259 stop:693 length:435 start_codon:yes stop_codon:yes gene_type:complete
MAEVFKPFYLWTDLEVSNLGRVRKKSTGEFLDIRDKLTPSNGYPDIRNGKAFTFRHRRVSINAGEPNSVREGYLSKKGSVPLEPAIILAHGTADEIAAIKGNGDGYIMQKVFSLTDSSYANLKVVNWSGYKSVMNRLLREGSTS